jgi:VanZ family protein
MEAPMKLKKFSWIPAIIVMIIIFAFSSKPADSSNESSMTVADHILSAYETTTQVQFDAKQRYQVLETMNMIVRKGSHFCEYALLAVTIAFHFFIHGLKGMRLLLLSVTLSAMYAATDEYHQTFIPGRSGQFRDVMIDTSGATAGMLFFFVVLMIYHSYRNRKYKKVKLNKFI